MTDSKGNEVKTGDSLVSDSGQSAEVISSTECECLLKDSNGQRFTIGKSMIKHTSWVKSDD